MQFLNESKLGRAKGYVVLMGHCVHHGGTWTVYRDVGDYSAYVRVMDADVLRGPEDIEESFFSLDTHRLQGLVVRSGSWAEVRLRDDLRTTHLDPRHEPVRSVRDTACISGVVFERESLQCLGAGLGKWDWLPARKHEMPQGELR